MSWLGKLNRVLWIFGVVLARIQAPQAARIVAFETVGFRWMTVKEFKRLGGKFN